jgi:hypothetical protein
MAIDTLAFWHQIARDRDVAGRDGLLSDHCVFHSPVVHTPQVGKAVTTQYLAAALQVFFNESFVYTRELTSDDHAILEFQVEINGITVNGVDMLTWDHSGQIIDFKVMVRPLKAVRLIHENMGKMLAAQQQPSS